MCTVNKEFPGDMGRISDRVRHEAAVWIARLHAPDRTAEVEDGLRRWLGESQVHRHAFELANELWDTAGRIPDQAVPRVMRWPAEASLRLHPVRTPRRRLPVWVAAAAMLMVAVGVMGWLQQDRVVRTGVGEQRTVTLEDGSRVSLNTATRLSLHFDAGVRRVRLQSGEALFEVARDAGRPFVVEAADRQVRALGTAFIVRRDAGRLAVTLMEGKVEVAPLRAASDSAVARLPRTQSGERSQTPDTVQVLADTAAAVILAPGERLLLADAATRATVDQPRLEPLMAWQRGLVALDYTPLSEAVAEMNRYSEIELVVAGTHTGEAKVSGVFRAGDSLSFAQAIAKTHGLHMVERQGSITLSGPAR